MVKMKTEGRSLGFKMRIMVNNREIDSIFSYPLGTPPLSIGFYFYSKMSCVEFLISN